MPVVKNRPILTEQVGVVELGPGQHIRDDGRIVHTDKSGSVLKDEDGEVEDVVFFVSPRYLRELSE